MAGWPSSPPISVVFPLPRKPVTSTTGSLPSEGKCGHQLRVERVELPTGETLCLDPHLTEIGDDGGTALAVPQPERPPAPIVEPQTEMVENSVSNASAGQPSAP